MKELDYPFDSSYILKNKKKIKKELETKLGLIEKRIAILGGSTTSEIKNILELFLLNYGIKPIFYESEYNKYYEDAMFGNEELDSFNPDIIYIHTSNVNILNYPTVGDKNEDVDNKLSIEFNRFKTMWEKLQEKFKCTIIQNNFELPSYRLLGNSDATIRIGKVNFISKLNIMFYDYANTTDNFFINDINYVSACFGIDKFSSELYYNMYKYFCDYDAIPYVSFNLAKIIKALFGKNKKAFVLDLDNTLWQGIVGDDGPENIVVGNDTSVGQAYYRFHKYLKEYNDIGIILNIDSKNEYENAIAGLNNPGSLLKPEDFIIIKANWDPKNLNVKSISEELNLGADSFVFVDDNPVERKIVSDYIEGISVVNANNVEDFIHVIDRNGYFETIALSDEDIKKKDMYKDNAKRSQMMSTFENYDDYLKSLEMKGEILPFKDVYLERISQLSNKSNQFNLTTKRYTLSEIEKVNKDDKYIKLYGKLSDIFGDNGVISVIIGEIKNKNELHIDLWIMSCRVLKRNMEFAMLDELVSICKKQGIEHIYGYYYPTLKNKMVNEFYDKALGFEKINEEDGNKTYVLDINKYENKNNVIEVNK